MTIKMALQNFIMSVVKKSFFMKLISSNTGVSSKNFFLVCTTTISMAEAAGFIGAVASLFAAAGLTKAGSEWSENKYIYNTSHKNTQTCEGDDEEVPIPNEGVVEE